MLSQVRWEQARTASYGKLPSLRPQPLSCSLVLTCNLSRLLAPQFVKAHPSSAPSTPGSSAVDLRCNQRVAVKKIREAFNNLEDAKRTLREVRLMRHLCHKNIISFNEILPPSPDLSFASLYVVMELMDTDLYQVICPPPLFWTKTKPVP